MLTMSPVSEPKFRSIPNWKKNLVVPLCTAMSCHDQSDLLTLEKIRDRQCSAALGLPNRIRDEDCDIEGLEISDLDEGPSTSYHEPFGRQTLEHIHYAIEMAKLSKLRERRSSTNVE